MLPLFLPELFQTKAAQNNETELNLGRAHSLYTFMSIQLLKVYTFHWLVVWNGIIIPTDELSNIFSEGVETNHQPVHHFPSIPIPPAAQIARNCLAAKMAWKPAAGFQLSGGYESFRWYNPYREPFGACFFNRQKTCAGQKTSKLPILSGSTGSSTLFWSHRGWTLKCTSAAFTWTHGHRRFADDMSDLGPF